MSSVLYILNENLEPLLFKNLKALPSLESSIAQFKKLYYDDAPPILSSNNKDFENDTFIYIQRDSLFFVSLLECGGNIMETLHYLDQAYLLLKNYFGVKALDKNLLLDNIILVMELLEETIDFGLIQVTDAGIIKDYIRVKINVPDIDTNNKNDDEFGSDSDSERQKKLKQKKLENRKSTKDELGSLKKKVLETWKGDKKKHKKKHKKKIKDKELEIDEEDTFMNSDVAKTTVMAVSWRAKGIHYAKNEFYVDVIEKVDYFMDYQKETVRKNAIHGEIVCKSFLSGMPKLHVSINKILNEDEQFLKNCKFHQCVSLDTIKNSKEIRFIPPDGDFILCKYELKRHINDQPMIKLSNFELKPQLEKFKLKMFITIETHFKPTNSTSKLNIKIPLKPIFKKYQIDLRKNIKSRCDEGKVLFNVSDDFLLWDIGKMSGGHGENQVKMGIEFALFNQDAYDKEQEELKNSMNPPPLVKGIKLDEIYKQVHEESQEDLINIKNTYDTERDIIDRERELTPVPSGQINQIDNDKFHLILMDFEIPYSTVSGLKIEYLKIDEEQLQYQSFPWVRYKTVNDDEYAYLI